jgi:GT2 family glycosyltransferase
MKVLVASPVFDGMEYCIRNFLDRVKSLSYDNYDVFLVDNSKGRDFAKRLKKNYGVDVLHLDLGDVSGMKKIVQCRNHIFNYAVENDYDYVLMMDSDVIPPVDILERLLAHKRDVVSGLYFGVFNVDRRQEVKPVAWKCLSEAEWEEVKGQLMSSVVNGREDIRRNLTDEEIDSGELQEVIIPSAGCMLVSRDIFRRFKYGILDVPGKINTGDDIYFCRKVREAGVKMYCDPSVKCEHLTEGKFKGDGIHPLHR